MTNLITSSDLSRQAVLDLEVEVSGNIDDILADTRLTAQAKRQLLTSWASDANAIAHIPWLRQLPDGSLVNVSEILRALKTLDAEAGTATSNGPAWLWQLPFKRRRRSMLRNGTRHRHKSSDDDDPPPCPAYAARRPQSGGGASSAISEAVPA